MIPARHSTLVEVIVMIISANSKITFLLILSFLGSLALAAETNLVIAPPNDHHDGCNLSVAGFTSKEPFLKFFDELKAASQKGDKAKLMNLVHYPLAINAGKPQKIKSKSQLKAKFEAVFTEKVKTVIASQKLEALSCRDQGVMYGDGDIWVGLEKGKVGITSINP